MEITELLTTVIHRLTNFPLKDNERTRAGLAHIATGGDGLGDSVLHSLPVYLRFGEYLQKRDLAAAKLLQPPADLRLEQDNQRQYAPLHNTLQHKAQRQHPLRGQCGDMSKSRTGALIVFERKNQLDEMLRSGTKLDAEVSSESAPRTAT